MSALRATLIAATAAAAAFCAPPPVAAGPPGGWVTFWDFDAGMARVERNPGKLGDVFLFAGRLDGAGAPVLARPLAECRDATRRIRVAGARPWLTVTNDRIERPGAAPVLKDADLVHGILVDRERRQGHVRALSALAVSLDVGGIDIDYENLAAEDRDLFSSFAAELAAELHGKGLLLSVTAQPKTGDSRSRGPGALDWRELCSEADRLQVMLYNQHNASTAPGPVAEPDWIEAVLRYGAGRCAHDRLVPVLKVIGMDWGPAKAEWVDHPTAAGRAVKTGARVRRLRDGRTPWFSYRGTDGDHVVYFEDARSLRAKMDVAARLGHAVVTLWALGSEDPELLRDLPAQNR